MANPKKLEKRRKSIRNIRKITRTMELIATARFQKAMVRATSVTAYTERMTRLVADLMRSGLEVNHPLLEPRESVERATLLVLTANRGLCGGFNGNVQRAGFARWKELTRGVPECRLEISGKRGVSGFRHRGYDADETFMHFEDKLTFDDVDVLASRYLDAFTTGRLDRLDVAYMKFESTSRQEVCVETLLPLGGLDGTDEGDGDPEEASIYEFLPSPESILEEVVPASFKVRLFKCFLDSVVSEQVARMVAMKGATENADDLIRWLTMSYNRARQGRITSELTDLIGGVEATK